MLNDNVEHAKKKLKVLKDQGINTHGVFSSYFFYFSVEQTPNYLDFVEWCSSNYSPSKGVIMDASRSKILCPINLLVIQNTMNIPADFTQTSKEYKEENILQFF